MTAFAIVALSIGSAEAALQPLVAGWQQFFEVDWRVTAPRGVPVLLEGDVQHGGART